MAFMLQLSKFFAWLLFMLHIRRALDGNLSSYKAIGPAKKHHDGVNDLLVESGVPESSQLWLKWVNTSFSARCSRNCGYSDLDQLRKHLSHEDEDSK